MKEEVEPGLCPAPFPPPSPVFYRGMPSLLRKTITEKQRPRSWVLWKVTAQLPPTSQRGKLNPRKELRDPWPGWEDPCPWTPQTLPI